MAFSTAFEKKLRKLFDQRTDWLRRKLGTAKPGKPTEFSRKKVDRAIQELQQLASDALAHKLARAEFEQHVLARKSVHINGHGRANQKANFEKWFRVHFPKAKGLIYTFWDAHGNAVYVGRTGSGGGRPSSYFDKYWFSRVHRITIFSVEGKSHLPKLECLAQHRFQPTINKNKASTKKWTKACPLCKIRKHIEGELRDIFRFK